jgi:hypothetical protein
MLHIRLFNSLLIGWVFLEAPETNACELKCLETGFGREPRRAPLQFLCFSSNRHLSEFVGLDDAGWVYLFLSLFSVVRPSSTGAEIIRALAAEMQEWAVRG